MNPEPGQILQDRYRIVKKLGEGGMGSVYEGEHLLIQRRVAIKILHSQLSERAEVVERFYREARAAAAIGHPHIIEVTDFGSLPDGSPYMVLEFLDGRDFSRDLTREGPQPIGKVAHILVQVCRALAAAHAKGVVHRDVKPENIFLVERHGDPNFVKVLDFGISKFRDTPDAAAHRLTKTGAALGTPYYMSPEACQGRLDLDHRADIYALGVILFQALTGEYPFDDATYPMLVLKICTQAPPDMAAWRPDLPAAITKLVRAMLQKRPADRPATFEEVADALTPFVEDQSDVRLTTNPPHSAAIQIPSVSAAGAELFPADTGETGPLRAPGVRSAKHVWSIAAAVLLSVAGMIGALLGFSLPSDPPVVETDGALIEPAPAPVQSGLPVEPPPPVLAETNPAEPSGPSEGAPPPPPAASRTSSVPVPPPEIEQVHLRIEVAEPRDVEMLLDGQPIPNPYEDDVPRSNTPMRLVVRAPGYTPLERPVFVNQDLDLPLILVEARGRRPPTVRAVPVPPSSPMTQSPFPSDPNVTYRGRTANPGPADEDIFRIKQRPTRRRPDAPIDRF